MIKFIAMFVCYFVASDIVFAVSLAVRALFEGAQDVPRPVAPWDLGFAIDSGLFGAFHWALLAFVTLPIFLLPVLLLSLLSRKPSRLAGSRARIVLSIGLGVITFGLRTLMLEYPTAFASPRSFFRDIVFTFTGATEAAAFCAGIFLASCLVHRLWPPVRPYGLANQAL